MIKNILKKRDFYLNKLIAFQDKEPIKIITGIRRCGKSKLLKLMVEHLLDEGKDIDQIIEVNFEEMKFSNMSYQDVYDYVKSKIVEGKRSYLFFDEIQKINNFETLINALRVEFDTDIYITGSNAYLLSSEYATLLSGRTVEIKMLPLSFKEFLDFQDFELTYVEDALNTSMKRLVLLKNNVQYTLEDVFNAYLKYGGMPGLIEVDLNPEQVQSIHEGIFNTVIVKDILLREAIRNKSNISDAHFLKKLVLFLADSIGSNVSFSSIANFLKSQSNNLKVNIPSHHTVENYINALVESFLFYEIKRFDIKGKEYLKTLSKYYICDIGIRNYLLGFRDRDKGHILENVVYFELLKRGYQVSVGKLDNKEIDFVANNVDEKIYIQVTNSILNEETKEREVSPLLKIKDNYRKVVLTLDNTEETINGIEVINLIKFLLN